MQVNFLVILLAGLVPMAMGFIWYNPKTLGNAWMKAAGVTKESMKGANMAVIFGLSFLFSFLIAFEEQFMVIHQFGFQSMLFNQPGLHDPSTPAGAVFKNVMDLYGTTFRTYKHGALHGFLTGLLFVTPILGTNALFERKGFKYIAINAGFWIINLTIMGAIICHFS